MNHDTVRQIALNLSLADIYSLCSSNKDFDKWVCQNPQFWLQKLKSEYPEKDANLGKHKYGSYKNFYELLESKTDINIVFKYKCIEVEEDYEKDYEKDYEYYEETRKFKTLIPIFGKDSRQISKILSQSLSYIDLSGKFTIKVNGEERCYQTEEINKNCFFGVNVNEANTIQITLDSDDPFFIDEEELEREFIEAIKTHSVD